MSDIISLPAFGSRSSSRKIKATRSQVKEMEGAIELGSLVQVSCVLLLAVAFVCNIGALIEQTRELLPGRDYRL